MKSSKLNYRIGMLAGVAGLALCASAQMTTPPAEKPAGWPKETPREPVVTKTETISMEEAIKRGLINPNGGTPAGSQPNQTQPTQAQPAQAAPAGTPGQPTMTKDQMHSSYDAWERDGSGNVVKLDRPLQWAALDKNKSITPAMRKKIDVFLEQRRTKVEQAVLNNMDKVIELDSGQLETFSMSDRTNLNKVLAETKPFTEIGAFASELKKADLLTQNSVQQHQIIVDDYRRLMLDDMKRAAGAKGAEKNGNADFVARAMFLTIADEARQIYYWMLSDSAETAADRVSTLGLAPDVEPKVRQAFEDAKAAKDESVRLAKMREGVALLTPQQARTLVEPVVKHAAGSSAAPASAPSNATSDASKAADR